MDTGQPTRSLDESVAQVMQTLPPVVRGYLAQGTYTMVAKDLITKYRLRIDQGGILEREIMLLLMGVDNPVEFMRSLTDEAKFDRQTVNGIMQDINVRIFTPLRAEEEKSRIGSMPPKPMNMPIPNYSPGDYAPPPQSPRYPNQENMNAFVRRVPQHPSAQTAKSPQGVQQPAPAQISAPLPPRELLPARGAPSINQLRSSSNGEETPLRQALRTVLPSSATADSRQPTSDIIPPSPKAPSIQYSADPYHEPIE